MVVVKYTQAFFWLRLSSGMVVGTSDVHNLWYHIIGLAFSLDKCNGFEEIDMRKMGGVSMCICACMLEVPLWGSGNIQYHRTISRCLCMCARSSTRTEVTVQ